MFAASVLNFLSWREQTQSFEQLAAVGYATFTISGSGEPEQLTGNPISPALTHVPGTRVLAGREFRRRGKARRSGRRDHRRRIVEAPLRLRPRTSWPHHFARWSAHDGRRHRTRQPETDRRGRCLYALDHRSQQRAAAERRDLRLRQAQARSHAAAGASGDGYDLGARSQAISGSALLGHSSHQHVRHFCGRRSQDRTGRAAGRGCVRIADRLRQHREPAAGPRRHAAKRNGRADSAGRIARPPDSSTSGGECRVLNPRRRSRLAGSGCRCARAHALAAGWHVAFS